MTPETNEAVARLVRNLTQCNSRIYAFIRSLVPGRADAEEVLQETTLTLLRKLEESDRAVNFLAWACAVARIEALRFRDRQRPGKLVFGQEFLDTVAEVMTEKANLLDARRDALARCVEKLPGRDRDLIRRRYEDGSPIVDIAREVGRSADAVYKALSRIRQALFDCVERALAAEGVS